VLALVLVKLFAATLITLAAAGLVLAQPAATATNPNVRHVIGLDTIKRDATGTLTVQDGALRFNTGKSEDKVPIASIDDIFIGTETTQSGGKTGRTVKIVAIAAPYESGKVLTLLMRTKVDILTVSFHDPDGALHGAIFALPIGQAALMRTQLIQAGAHSSPLENQASEGSKP
jgi:hypothetical protein